MSTFQALTKKRRSIYQLGKDVALPVNDVTNLIQDAVREAPSAFNSQSSRVVILYSAEHEKLWNIVESELRKVVPAEQFAATEAKINAFRAAFGTVLYFEDQNVVKGLQESYPLYADNFPKWSQESTAIAQYSVWVALAEQGIGASVQHYNPLINSAVAATWDLPESWTLHAQMPFGSIVAEASEKGYMDNNERFRVFNS